MPAPTKKEQRLAEKLAQEREEVNLARKHLRAATNQAFAARVLLEQALDAIPWADYNDELCDAIRSFIKKHDSIHG